jgi:hypothetical protein
MLVQPALSIAPKATHRRARDPWGKFIEINLLIARAAALWGRRRA